MKNKKSLYFLIPLVVIIWGLLFYKIFAHLNNNNATNQNIMPFNIKSDPTANVDTFNLLANYPDPFIDKPYLLPDDPSGQNPSDLSKEPLVKPKPVVVKESLPWPVITYGGIIKNNLSNKTIVIVYINGAGKIMSLGETANNVILRKIYRDSIIVEFNKEIKKFIKK